MLVSLATPALAQPADEPQKINVESIGDSITLVGRLGVPLGTKITIRGNWSYPKAVVKDASARLTIHHVDGKRLEVPVEFNIAQTRVMTREHRPAIAKSDKKLLNGQEWTMIAYETGYIGLSPGEDGARSPTFPVVGMPYYTEAFTSELVAVVIAKKDEP